VGPRRSGRAGLIIALVLCFVAGVLVAIAFLTADLRDIISTEHIPVPVVPGEGEISLALTGDTSWLPPARPGDPLSKVADLVRGATLGFTNLEITLADAAASRDRRLQGKGRIAGDDGAELVRALGFDLVSLANDHTMDFGARGLRLTEQSLDLAGVLHAGAGVDLAEARAPVFAGQGARQIALIAATASASPDAMAVDAEGGAAARAGVNPLRYTVGEVTISDAQAGGADRTAVRFTVNGSDRAQLLETIRRARQKAPIVIVSLHSHEPSNASDQPADFIRQFARDAIDAGASLVVGHGPHRVRGFERYKSGLVLYSLGHFAYDPGRSDLLASDPFDADTYLNGGAQGMGPGGSPESQLERAEWWQGIMALVTFRDGGLSQVLFYALDLGGPGGGQRGVPALARGERQEAILHRFSAISGPDGLELEPGADGSAMRLPISEKR
jgi:poly-gamma-glutamate synthesis protein (capsule biosynthesis protein)